MPYKSIDTARQKYGSNDVEYPILGKNQAHAALKQTQSSKDLHDICLRDLPEAREYFGDRLEYFVPHNNSDVPKGNSDQEAGMQTIDALVDRNTTTTEMVVTFPCETLDEMCQLGSTSTENLLHSTLTTCTVLPENAMLPLHHSNEGTTTMTLLAGSIVWIVWPSTRKNVGIFQAAYESFEEDFDATGLDVAGDLEGGVTFMQTVGDGLRIPPYSLLMGLATTTSVLASSSRVTVENFTSMLSKLPLLKAWFQTEIDGIDKQSRFIASILHWLDLLLNGDPDDEDNDEFKLPRTKNGLLGELLGIWDAIKNDLAAMMGPADMTAMELIWGDFLVNAVGRECRICGVRVDNKQKRMKKHFITKHSVDIKAANGTQASGFATAHEEENFEDGGAMDLDD